MRWIVVAGKGKAVKGLEPAVIGITPLLGSSKGDHENVLVKPAF
jgi:hypothetical protein